MRVPAVATLLALIASQTPSSSVGAPETFQVVGTSMIVSTHLTPSAGQVTIFGADFAVKASFGGYLPMRVSADLLVVGRNLIHFAPAHPEALAVFDIKANRLARLYPSDGTDDLSSTAEPSITSPARRAYRDALAPLFAAAAKTQGPRSYGWDPDWFNVSIDRTTFRYDPGTDALEFRASFSTDAIPNGPTDAVLVTCVPMHSPKRVCAERPSK